LPFLRPSDMTLRSAASCFAVMSTIFEAEFCAAHPTTSG
jgi:hypothetical protein